MNDIGQFFIIVFVMFVVFFSLSINSRVNNLKLKVSNLQQVLEINTRVIDTLTEVCMPDAETDTRAYASTN